MTKNTMTHRTTSRDTTRDSTTGYLPEVARAAAIQRARGPRRINLRRTFRTVASIIERPEVGMTVPYRDAPR